MILRSIIEKYPIDVPTSYCEEPFVLEEFFNKHILNKPHIKYPWLVSTRVLEAHNIQEHYNYQRMVIKVQFECQ